MKFNEETVLKAKAILMAAMLLTVTTNQAYAAYTRVDTPTVTTTAVVDPLDKYRGATELSSTELVDLLELVGFKGKSLKLAWAITMRESRGHPTSHNTSKYTGDNSYGLFP